MYSRSPINAALITVRNIFRLGANGLNYKRWKSIKLFTLASFKFSSLNCNALNEFLNMSIYQPILKFLLQQIYLNNYISIITNFLRTGYRIQGTGYYAHTPRPLFGRWIRFLGGLKSRKNTILMWTNNWGETNTLLHDMVVWKSNKEEKK